MRVITIKAPWTVPILLGFKTVENRRQPTDWRGPLAIHVSRSWCPIGAADSRVRSAAYQNPSLRDFALTPGAVVAVAALTDCHQATDHCCPEWGDRNCWHLVLRQVNPLPRPLPARGALGVWSPNSVLASALQAGHTMNLPFVLARNWAQRHTFRPENADEFAAWFIYFYAEELTDPTLTYSDAWETYRFIHYGDRG